jgi:hypothetical protein
MLDLTGHMIIWGGLFAHGDGFTGLMKVVFCYALRVIMWPPSAKLPRSAAAVLNGCCRARLDMSRSSLSVVLRGLGRARVWRQQTLHFRTTTFWAQLLFGVEV